MTFHDNNSITVGSQELLFIWKPTNLVMGPVGDLTLK